MKIFLNFVLLILCLSTFAFGQETTPPDEDEDIIRISSKLVLIDTIVLDKDGKPVTDLSADDFELYQDGKLQKITNFAFVNAGKNPVADSSETKNKAGKKNLPLPPVSVRSNYGRIITFVIDDGSCSRTPISTRIATIAVKKFIDEQMLPDDKVAIYRTRGGASLLQSYTSNKEVLRRIVDKITLLPPLNCGNDFEYSTDDVIPNPPSGSEQVRRRTDKNAEQDIWGSEESRRVTRGTIGVLSLAVDRLKNVPGRKTIFLISDRIGVGFEDDLEIVSDKATRASVVVYTLSSRGLTIPGMSNAEGERSNTNRTSSQISGEWLSGTGMEYLAHATGGKFIRGKNFLDTEIEKILESESGYYLLGYQPDDETFKGKGFHKIEVKLKRPGLKIASRKGFYGQADVKTEKKQKTSEPPLYQAIAAPFSEKGIDLRLTTLVGNDEKQGGYIRALGF